MIGLVIVAGIVVALVWALGFVYKQLDNIGGAITINQRHPGFYRWVLMPILWIVYAVVAIVVLTRVGLSLAQFVVLCATAAAWWVWRWVVAFMGDNPLTRAGITSAIRARVLTEALRRAFVTTGLGRSLGRRQALPVTGVVRPMATVTDTPFGVEIDVTAAMGGGSLADIESLLGKDRKEDRFTSEVNGHLDTLRGPLAQLARTQGWLDHYVESHVISPVTSFSGAGTLQMLADDPLQWTHLYADRFPPLSQRALGWRMTGPPDDPHHGAYIGVDRPGRPQRISMRYCTLLQGAPGTGKSIILDCILASAIECTDPVLNIVVDMKAGAHMWPWREGVSGFVYTPDAVSALFAELFFEMYRRLIALANDPNSQGLLIEATPEMPWINVFFDEAQLAEDAVIAKGGLWEMIIRVGRAVGVQIFTGTQYATADSGLSRMGIVSIPSRLSTRVTDSSAAIVATGGAREAISPDRIPDSDRYRGVVVVNDDNGRRAMVKAPFLTVADKLERARLNAPYVLAAPEWLDRVCSAQSWEAAMARWESKYRPLAQMAAHSAGASSSEPAPQAPAPVDPAPVDPPPIDTDELTDTGRRLAKLVGKTPSAVMRSAGTWLSFKRTLGNQLHPSRISAQRRSELGLDDDEALVEWWSQIESDWYRVRDGLGLGPKG